MLQQAKFEVETKHMMRALKLLNQENATRPPNVDKSWLYYIVSWRDLTSYNKW